MHDDSQADPELVAWAADALLAGQPLPEILTALIENGWPADEAEAAVERARVQTRRQRGVFTRADVAGTIDAQYRTTTTGLAAFHRSGVGLLGFVSFFTGFRSAVAAARRLRRVARGNGADQPSRPL